MTSDKRLINFLYIKEIIKIDCYKSLIFDDKMGT